MGVAGKAMIRPSGKRGVMSSGKAGVHASDEDCCQCNTCDDVQFPCEITLVHIDENRCEDDIFDIFMVNQESWDWSAALHPTNRLKIQSSGLLQ